MVGIDLGTTNSSISYWDGGQARIIPNAFGEPRTPSVVCIRADGTAVVGTPALRNRLLDPENTVSRVKRFIGRRYIEVFDLAQSVSFPVVIGKQYRGQTAASCFPFGNTRNRGLSLESLVVYPWNPF
jgi:molecular chaperone DnaK